MSLLLQCPKITVFLEHSSFSYYDVYKTNVLLELYTLGQGNPVLIDIVLGAIECRFFQLVCRDF